MNAALDMVPRAGYLRDTRRGRLYQLEDRSTLGRDLANTIVVEEPDISRSHAEIVRHGDAFSIVPHVTTVTSVNGTLLLTPRPLHEGDEITMGNAAFRFTSILPSGARIDVPSRPTAWRAVQASRAPTLFLGRIEARDRRRRDAQRKLSRLVAIVVAGLAIVFAVGSLYMTPRTPVRAAPRWSTGYK